MNRLEQAIPAGIIMLVGLWVAFTSYTQTPAEAFVFPRLVSAVFVAISAIATPAISFFIVSSSLKFMKPVSPQDQRNRISLGVKTPRSILNSRYMTTMKPTAMATRFTQLFGALCGAGSYIEIKTKTVTAVAV